MKRMSERALKQYIRSSTNINGIFAAQDAMAYRRALRKVRNELRQWCANHQISHDGSRPFAMGHLVEIMDSIDRALGAKQ